MTKKKRLPGVPGGSVPSHMTGQTPSTRKEVLDALPVVKRFILRGEVTLADYNQNWPSILCAEIAKKIGCSLVYSRTLTSTPNGPMPIITTWFMGISYRFIFGYQTDMPDLSEEEAVRQIVGALYNHLAVVGAVPSGIARLCARYDMLRPVVLLCIPWWQHLMQKLGEQEFSCLRLDVPTSTPVGDQSRFIAKVEKLTIYMQRWSVHYWSSKIFMRCPAYVNMVRLWGAGVPNLRLPNEQFNHVYESSGWIGGKIDFSTQHLTELMDPQKQRDRIKTILDEHPPEPHPLVLDLPPKLVAYVECVGIDALPIKPEQYIDFLVGGADESKTPAIFHSNDADTLVVDARINDKDAAGDKPSDFTVTVKNTQRLHGPSILIHNIPVEPHPELNRIKERTTTKLILSLIGISEEEFEIVGRVDIPSVSKFYKKPSLHVRLDKNRRCETINFIDLNKLMRADASLRPFMVVTYKDEDLKEDRKRKGGRSQEKGGDRERAVGDKSDQRRRSRSRDRARDRGRDNKGRDRSGDRRRDRSRDKGRERNRDDDRSRRDREKDSDRRPDEHAAETNDVELNYHNIRDLDPAYVDDTPASTYLQTYARDPYVPVLPALTVSMQGGGGVEPMSISPEIDDTLIVGDDLKEEYARRIKHFVTRVAEAAGCKLVISSVMAQQIKCQVKMTDFPFMLIGGVGLATDKKQAESVALVTIMSRLVEVGLLPNSLVDVVSAYDEWIEPIVEAMGTCLNFAKAVLKSPDYRQLLIEVENWQRSGVHFVGPTRPDQFDTINKFTLAVHAFCVQNWQKTTVWAPDNSKHLPVITDGSVIVLRRSSGASSKRKTSRSRSRSRDRKKRASRSRSRGGRRKRSRTRSRSPTKRNGRHRKSRSRSPPRAEPPSVPAPVSASVNRKSSTERELSPTAELRRLAEEEAELERKNAEIQRQLELLEKGGTSEDIARILESLNNDKKSSPTPTPSSSSKKDTKSKSPSHSSSSRKRRGDSRDRERDDKKKSSTTKSSSTSTSGSRRDSHTSKLPATSSKLPEKPKSPSIVASSLTSNLLTSTPSTIDLYASDPYLQQLAAEERALRERLEKEIREREERERKEREESERRGREERERIEREERERKEREECERKAKEQRQKELDDLAAKELARKQLEERERLERELRLMREQELELEKFKAAQKLLDEQKITEAATRERIMKELEAERLKREEEIKKAREEEERRANELSERLRKEEEQRKKIEKELEELRERERLLNEQKLAMERQFEEVAAEAARRALEQQKLMQAQAQTASAATSTTSIPSSILGPAPGTATVLSTTGSSKVAPVAVKKEPLLQTTPSTIAPAAGKTIREPLLHSTSTSAREPLLQSTPASVATTREPLLQTKAIPASGTTGREPLLQTTPAPAATTREPLLQAAPAANATTIREPLLQAPGDAAKKRRSRFDQIVDPRELATATALSAASSVADAVAASTSRSSFWSADSLGSVPWSVSSSFGISSAEPSSNVTAAAVQSVLNQSLRGGIQPATSNFGAQQAAMLGGGFDLNAAGEPEMADEHMRVLRRLEELRRQLRETAASSSGSPPTDASASGFPSLMSMALAPPRRSEVDEVTQMRLRALRKQLPPFVPDWALEFINMDENISPPYLEMVCIKVQSPSELKELLLEPKYCRVDDPNEKVCPFHRHVGLRHKAITCGVQLPWSRRLKLADINGICSESRLCIIPHYGKCRFTPSPCEVCGERHFLPWCKKHAKLRHLFDIKDNERMTGQPATANFPKRIV